MRGTRFEESASVFVPATVANVGPGFDILGLALDGAGDTVRARFSTDGSRRAAVSIASISGDDGRLPLDPELNTASIAALHTLRRAGLNLAIELQVEKGLPIGSGLGGSAASAVAAACAVNLLVGSPLRKEELIVPCIEAEAVVAGRHADNVAPALLGGLTLVRSVDPLKVVRIPLPSELLVVVVTPDFELNTRAAREALPGSVPLAVMVEQSAQLASFVSACYSGDLGLLAESLTDPVITPARIGLVPGGAEAIAAAKSVGALGASLSGSGPSIFALCHSPAVARDVVQRMQAAFEAADLESHAVISPADNPGARRVA